MATRSIEDVLAGGGLVFQEQRVADLARVAALENAPQPVTKINGAEPDDDGEVTISTGTVDLSFLNGGAVGQVLSKASTDDRAFAWIDPPAGGEGGGGSSEPPLEQIIVALSDNATALTTGVAKETLRLGYPFVLTATPRASLSTASTSGVVTVDINREGVSLLATKLTVDANEKTSKTAAAPATLASTSIGDDDEITFDIDTAGTGAKGLKVILIGRRA